MKTTSFRDTWAEVSLQALAFNVKQFKQHIRKEAHFMAVVKADGYGHGAVAIAEEALANGADWLGVAFLDEGLALREAGITAPLLLLGYTPDYAVHKAIEQDLTLTVYSKETIAAICQAARSLGKKAKVHIKVDTGMTRIGIRSAEEALELCQALDQEEIEVEGIFTHFAEADNGDSSDYTNQQFESFQQIYQAVETKGYKIPVKHCCNSAGTIAYPEMHLDMVRVGVSLYGLYPEPHLKEILPLKQVMSLKTKPVLIKSVPAGQSISYGRTYTTKEEVKIATLPIGYADGLSRLLSNQGHVTLRGVECLIVGRICMDQTMVDVSNVDDVHENDIVTIFGEPSEGYISLDVVAKQMQTIHYETVCLIGKRVPRKYVK
ncbi:alanine racemase [Oceanobacillus neutriphilus]|uniref:Alanine racemase n=1 Tax=Oceanobacillus neutriphilus TaxID=531815 RepID=A0ABQ2NSQ9_9BACI|nr:alanine racemase [Oceanobacillus neutriphilus]GGP09923.1 alanine racemase [Oceanobacillus neutriphilus]